MVFFVCQGKEILPGKGGPIGIPETSGYIKEGGGSGLCFTEWSRYLFAGTEQKTGKIVSAGDCDSGDRQFIQAGMFLWIEENLF
ncbi:MAG: hypothetical protein H6618_08880 [Deltaproteobacteria bacterium]|nr:hypothetical protein [Deltaproteobacteria bacterium]